MRLDHVIILVDQVDAATLHFEELGFTVLPGGVHEGGLTHNAIIVFEDGTYLELLAPTQLHKVFAWREARQTLGTVPVVKDNLAASRFMDHIVTGEGLVDYALMVDDMEAALSGAALEGLSLAGPVGGQRAMDDGTLIQWSFGLPDTIALPFLIQDRTNREMRVPSGECQLHDNGVTGIAGLEIAAKRFSWTTSRIAGLTGVQAETPEPGKAIFAIGDVLLTYVKPSQSNALAANTMRHRGPRPFSLRLRARGVSEDRLLDPDLCHGARISVGK